MEQAGKNILRCTSPVVMIKKGCFSLCHSVGLAFVLNTALIAVVSSAISACVGRDIDLNMPGCILFVLRYLNHIHLV